MGANEFTGRTGRVVGFFWGSAWFGIGVAAAVVVADGLGQLPPGVEGPLVALVPQLLSIAGPDTSPLGVALFFGLFAAIGLLYGPYEVTHALTEPDYSIDLSRH